MGCKTSMCSEAGEFLTSQEVEIFSQSSTLHSVEKKKKEPARDMVDTASWLFKERTNFSDLMIILEQWITQVYRGSLQAISSKEDIKTSLAVDTDGNLKIMHTLEGCRDFSLIETFCKNVNKTTKMTRIPAFDTEKFKRIAGFLINLSPLTICLYLKLGGEIDCGVGVEKPMSQKQLSLFLMNSAESGSISSWMYKGSHPIPTFFSFSCLYDSRKVTFFIFDGLKTQNFEKAFGLFDHFGGFLSEDLKQTLLRSKTEEIQVTLTLNNRRVLSLNLLIPDLSAAEDVISSLEGLYGTEKMLKFGSVMSPAKFGLSLKPSGFSLLFITCNF